MHHDMQCDPNLLQSLRIFFLSKSGLLSHAVTKSGIGVGLCKPLLLYTVAALLVICEPSTIRFYGHKTPPQDPCCMTRAHIIWDSNWASHCGKLL